ncbi:MAG: serpin family protein [Pirellulales bacterium]
MRCQGWGVVFALLLVAGCGKESAPVARPPLGEAHREVVAQSNSLALKTYAGLRDEPGNLVVSPYGLSLSLTMLLSGADGPTRDELLTLLGTTAKQEPQLHVTQGELQRWLTGGGAGGEQLDVAAAIFIQRDTDVLREFLKLLETQYQSEAEVVDFANQPATARKVINDWAAEKSDGKIDTVVEPDDITAQTRVMLASAVYFKGAWEHAFERSGTKKQPFYIAAEESVDCELMHQTEEFGYVHQDGVRVLVMPYRGRELSMVVILPDEKDGLSAVEEQLDDETVASWIVAAEKNIVKLPVWLPRFKFESGHDLESTLVKLGITTAFDPTEADLSRIDGVRPTSAGAGRLYVDQIWQQALIEVNEEGTEAAAVTTIKSTETSTAPPDAPRFRADHPFLFLIRENANGLILFLGRVVDPSKAG